MEDDEHGHLTVSSKSVADYFKEKMRLVVSKPRCSETEIDEAPRGGIGFRLILCDNNEVEEDGGLRGGLGMGLLSKTSATETLTETTLQEETPKGKEKREEKRKERKHWSEGGEGEVNRKPKKTGKRKA